MIILVTYSSSSFNTFYNIVFRMIHYIHVYHGIKLQMNEHTVGVWVILILPIILGGKLLIHTH